MNILFTQFGANGKVRNAYKQQGETDKKTERLYAYAVKVATDDSFLIELMSGDEILKSHRVTYDPQVQEPPSLRAAA